MKLDKKKAGKFLVKNRIKIIVIALILALIVTIVVMGFLGGKEAFKAVKECEIGLGDGETICWKYRNATDYEILENLGLVPEKFGVQK